MSDLHQSLRTEFQDEDYRYAYAESFLNTKIATQIKTLREQREMTQAEVATKIGIKQPGYRRFEDVNHSVWKTDSLWAIARAYGVRVNVSFETFGSLIRDKQGFTKESLKRAEFKDDPAFKEPATQADRTASASTASLVDPRLSSGMQLPDLSGKSQLDAKNLLKDDFKKWMERTWQSIIKSPETPHAKEIPQAEKELRGAAGKVIPIDSKRPKPPRGTTIRGRKERRRYANA